MANEAYSQAYLTGQAPDLARALAQMQYNQQQAQNYDKQIIAEPTRAGQAWNNVIPTLMRDYKMRQNNDMMQGQVIPAQQSLAEKLQTMMNGGQPQRNPQDVQQYQQDMQRFGMAKDFGLPGADAQQEAYRKAYDNSVSNSWISGGSLNPEAQANAAAAQDQLRKQNEIIAITGANGGALNANLPAYQQAVKNSGFLPNGLPPLTQTTSVTGATTFTPTANLVGGGQNIAPAPTERGLYDAMVADLPAAQSEIKNNSNVASLLDSIESKAEYGGSNLLKEGGNFFNKYFTENNNAGLKLLEKDIATLAAAQGAAGNGSTDAARALIGASLPNEQMQPDAIRGAVRLVRARMNLSNDTANIKQSFILNNQNNPQAVRQYNELKSTLNSMPLLVNMMQDFSGDSSSIKSSIAQFRKEYPNLSAEQAADIAQKKYQLNKLKQQYGGQNVQ